MDFKANDLVVCVNNFNVEDLLTIGSKYKILKVHENYIDIVSDVLQVNTFPSNKFKLKKTDGIISCIKDSGDRTAFESGAVRDLQNNKNEDRLVPYYLLVDDKTMVGRTLFEINLNEDFESINILITLLKLETPDLVERLAKHYTEGANKYDEYNWCKGIPLKSYKNSAARHYYAWKIGKTDEDHLAALLWNIIGLKYELLKTNK